MAKLTLKDFNSAPMIKNYRRMWPFIKPYWFRALLGVLLTIPIGSLDAAIAMFLKPLMDNVMVEKQPHFSALLPFLIVGFTVIQGVLNYSAAYLNTWVGSKMTTDIKRRLYDKLLSMDTAYFDKNNSGTILIRYSTDAESASTGLVNNLKQFLSKFFSSLALVFVLFYNSWHLAVIAVVILVVSFYPLRIVRAKMKEIITKSVGAGSIIMTLYNETFSGNRTIHSFTMEERQRANFKSTTDDIFTLSMKMVQGTNWISPAMHIIMSVGIALVVGFGSYLIVNGIITSGNFVAFIAALLMLYTPMKTVGNNYVAVQQSFMAIDRIFDILDLQPKLVCAPDAKEITGIRDSIVFDKVHFSYNADKEVLKDVSLKIKTGQTVALVGNSGGGKTTISSLIPRLYDVTGGAVKVDGANVRDIKISSLRKNIAIVFQDNFLFSGTIRDNIIAGNPAASEQDVIQAVKNAYLDDFIKSLPAGLDTEIGERGILLSGGQKQRVAIARAFLKNAPVVILDEATSALDNKSEKIVQEAIDNLMKNRTVIVIAHRLSTVRHANKIVVINDGKIAEEGTHEELLKLGGPYYALYNSQFKKQETPPGAAS
ncbi:MAG: ABC transporter ATP-binding protein/permease [Elusimicrobiota bacterium]|jgi:subfamily B ATP-binding cassette protein MsbA|nr:ABC transporter ATP-binding protein/permease [Elusimicrobiota bacterium]